MLNSVSLKRIYQSTFLRTTPCLPHEFMPVSGAEEFPLQTTKLMESGKLQMGSSKIRTQKKSSKKAPVVYMTFRPWWLEQGQWPVTSGEEAYSTENHGNGSWRWTILPCIAALCMVCLAITFWVEPNPVSHKVFTHDDYIYTSVRDNHFFDLSSPSPHLYEWMVFSEEQNPVLRLD